MERKRTRSGLFSEEEEEDMDKRSSQRFRKRVRYFEDDEEEEEEEEEDDEEEDEQEENEQPGPSTQNTHNKRTQENGLLHVTCGNKMGILDVERLQRGEVCIECEGRWFAPPAFEDFGGKGPSKKWKTSIFHENKPLQFWFEQGSLTTKGFKRRGTETAKQKNILSTDCESESPSEESEISLQSAEDTEEDDVKDEDWHPGSEELAPEREEEEERVGSGNGGEVVEEEDKMEKGEMEDADFPAVVDNDSDNDVFEGTETKLIITAAKKSALQMKLQVLIERLPEVRHDHLSNCTEYPVVADCFTLDENAQSEEERGHNASTKDDTSIASAAHIDPAQLSDPPIVRSIKEENGEELSESIIQSNNSEEDGQSEIKTEAVNSPSLATSSPDIKPADIIGVGPPTILIHSTYTECISENSGHTDVTTPGQFVAQLQEMEQEKRCPQTVQASDMLEGPSSGPSSGFNLDTMDLDQLKREKIKMQLKVLKLKEEYYTLQIKKFKR